MSSHPYVTQQNTPLADDTTLMSTTDLQSYITHTMTPCAGERPYLQEFIRAAAQHGASPGYAKSGVCGYVVHPEKGSPRAAS